MKINYDNFSEYILGVVEDFRKSELSLDQYCSLNAESDFAILDSCLHLSQLSSERINQIGAAKAPPSSWYIFVQVSDAGDEIFKQALDITAKYDPNTSKEPLLVKLRAILDKNVSEYPLAKDLKVAGPVGLHFSALDQKESLVFKNMAGYLSKNGHLTPKQVNWIKSLITKIKSKKISGRTIIEKEALLRLFDWAR